MIHGTLKPRVVGISIRRELYNFRYRWIFHVWSEGSVYVACQNREDRLSVTGEDESYVALTKSAFDKRAGLLLPFPLSPAGFFFPYLSLLLRTEKQIMLRHLSIHRKAIPMPSNT